MTEDLHPRDAGKFADKPQSAPDIQPLVPSLPAYTSEQLNGPKRERSALVADLALRTWPGAEGLADAELLDYAMVDLVFWSDWAKTQAQFGWVPRVDKDSPAVDLITAEHSAKGHFAAESEFGEDDDRSYSLDIEDIGRDCGLGEVASTPEFTGRGARKKSIQASVLRAHDALSRWNYTQTAAPIDPDNQLSDALADLMHWAKAHEVSFADSVVSGLDSLEKETGR